MRWPQYSTLVTPSLHLEGFKEIPFSPEAIEALSKPLDKAELRVGKNNNIVEIYLTYVHDKSTEYFSRHGRLEVGRCAF